MLKKLCYLLLLSALSQLNWSGERAATQFATKSYAQLKNYFRNRQSYLAIVWPLVPLNADLQIEQQLKKFGQILYKQSFMLTLADAHWLLRTAHPHILNTAEHVQWYFPDDAFTRPARVYILLFDSLELAVATKHKIRHLFKFEYRAIHITDTNSEVRTLGKFFFKRN